jgi:hypothetical protein
MVSVAVIAGAGSRLYTEGSGGDSPGDPLFFDDFNYSLDRVDTGSAKTSVVASHGWGGMKDTNHSAGARGYIYTVTSIEGDSAGIPGGGRALCIEANPISSGGSQSDLYIQYGAEPGVLGTLPANCWFQYWVYLQRDAGSSKVSAAPGGKFLYALHGSRTTYPMHPFDCAWLLGCSDTAYDPSTGTPTVTAPEEGAYTYTVEPLPVVDPPSSADPSERRAFISAQNSAGHPYFRMSPMEDPEFTHFLPNKWYLVKINLDTSGSTGVWRMWAREKGDPDFTLMADFRHGVAPTAAFTWNTFQDYDHGDGTTKDNEGARILRIPTTASSDYWMYLKDFCFAGSEADLPTYGAY